jgi:hypothetical protein
MKSKTIVKQYRGYTFLFNKNERGSYTVSVNGLNSYWIHWYQQKTSVREALKNLNLF